ncbi:RNA polymerase sigma-70 factor [Pedobacter aquae]|uniref:RNA polymerase sigma-70 factor n=1 Tax=Pedobacter aquae TaxID=2605747 RepID=A0A5C0VLJ7_9SPHI|nr:RNA polymerase sigma-70 factor [Pedobacter aquae]QEK52541.1 RNA polymerase sigma-70 factor [Pedobacter aquae]
MQTANGFEAIFKAYYAKLIFFANRYVNDLHAAEEIVSDAFSFLWERKEQYQFDADFKGYLYKMVQNRAFNYLKHKKIENEYVSYLQKNNLLSETPAFEENPVCYKEFEYYIKEAIENLPQRCKEVFKLSRFEELRNKEIAQQLHISPKTVERQMTIALEKLRFKLQHLLSFIALFFF